MKPPGAKADANRSVHLFGHYKIGHTARRHDIGLYAPGLQVECYLGRAQRQNALRLAAAPPETIKEFDKTRQPLTRRKSLVAVWSVQVSHRNSGDFRGNLLNWCSTVPAGQKYML